jgi:hypothetical protein
VPLAYDVHPEFGYFCPGPRLRRELRVALVSILLGMVIGAAIATVRAGKAGATDGVSSNAHPTSSTPSTLALGVAGPSYPFKNADTAKADPVQAIKPYPMRIVRMRSSKPASPLAGIPLGRTVPPEPDIVPGSAGQASPENAEGPEGAAISLRAQSFAASAEPAVSGTRKRLE